MKPTFANAQTNRRGSGRCLLLPLALLLLIGLPTAFAANGDTVKVAVGSQPYTLNPHGSDADSNLSIVSNLFDGLVQRNADGEISPALATEWERTGELTWQFGLREGVTFQNGNEFTWEDVAFTFERLKDGEVSEFTSFGALIDSVELVDGNPWTVEVTTTESVPYFVENLHQIWIMDKESTEERSAGEVGENPIGTGAYSLVEWRKGSYIKMTANPDYWEGEPEVTNAEIHPITEASTRLAAISSGKVDILQDVPVAFLDTIKNDPKVELTSRPARRSMFLTLNNREGNPTADRRVREAMYMAIDEDLIIEKIMFGAASPAAQIPDEPTVGYSDAIERLPYDVERARELMNEAGYADGFAITLAGPNDRYVQDKEIMAAVASQLSQIGIDVTVDDAPSSIYLAEVSDNDFDFSLLGWFDGSYDFGRSYVTLIHTVEPERGRGSLNAAGYSDPEVDELYEKATKTIDPDERAAVLRKMNEIMMEHVAVIPLHYQMDTYAVNQQSDVNFTPRNDTWIMFKEMSW